MAIMHIAPHLAKGSEAGERYVQRPRHGRKISENIYFLQ
jgi:hypothetical protein